MNSEENKQIARIQLEVEAANNKNHDLEVDIANE
jgi:hypothetical protein